MKKNELTHKYLKKQSLLILHLTDRCNNHCKFCMIDEIHSPFCFPYEVALELIDTMPVKSKIDCFGGEPTLYPHFFDLLQHVSSKDLECSVATNGRLFAKKSFTDKVVEITQSNLYVRTSLYGYTAESHDSLTRVKRSFQELMIGLDNIVSAGMPCQVNIVLTTQNLPKLLKMTRLIIDKGIKRIKFGLLTGSQSCIDIVPTLSEIRSPLLQSLQLAKKNNLRIIIEKAPLCLVPEYIHEFSSERDLCLWSRYFDDERKCRRCIMRKWCDGLDPGYVQFFGTEGITPIYNVSQAVLKPFPLNFKEDYINFLKINLFSMPEKPIYQKKCEKIMIQLINETKRKFARIAFVPSHLYDTSYAECPAVDPKSL